MIEHGPVGRSDRLLAPDDPTFRDLRRASVTAAESGREAVGFVGLGVMGRPMAANLARAGYPVLAYNRSALPGDDPDVATLRIATRLADLASTRTIITMLPDDAAVTEVLDGPDGLISRLRPGSLIIDMSTVSPGLSRALAKAGAERGVRVLDAPVSGGDVGAKAGTLSIMVGGDQRDFDDALPIFEVLGTRAVLCGPPGSGQAAKACNQIVVAVTIAVVSEALVLGSKLGLAPEAIVDVLSAGLAGNRVMEVRRHNFLDHDFTPGFKVDLHYKDLGIALSAGESLGMDLPLTTLAQQMFEQLRAQGRGDQDHSALLTLFETQADHRIGPRLTEN